MLIRYIRSRKTGEKVGVVVAMDKEHIGWAKKNKKDNFSREFAFKVACGRAIKGSKTPLPFRSDEYDMQFDEAIEKMKIRAAKYYKDGPPQS